jgi:hypothetical protein
MSWLPEPRTRRRHLKERLSWRYHEASTYATGAGLRAHLSVIGEGRGSAQSPGAPLLPVRVRAVAIFAAKGDPCWNLR